MFYEYSNRVRVISFQKIFYSSIYIQSILESINHSQNVLFYLDLESSHFMGMSRKKFSLFNRKSQTGKCLITIGPSTIIFISVLNEKNMYSKAVSFPFCQRQKKGRIDIEKVHSTVVHRLDMVVIFAVIYVCKKYGMNFLS